MTSNDDVLKAIAALEKKHDDFQDQYELDMRGDKNTQNGNIGLVGVIRKQGEVQKKNPSMLYLLRNFPIRTIGTILFVIVIVIAIVQIVTPEFILTALATIIY